MTTEANKAMIRRWLEEAWNKGNLDVINETFAANLTYHDPTNPGVSGTEGFKQLLSTYRTAFPDARFTVEDQIAEGDKVVTRWTARGTHRAELQGISPTNKQATVTGIDIDRIVDGKVEEHWSNWDALGLM